MNQIRVEPALSATAPTPPAPPVAPVAHVFRTDAAAGPDHIGGDEATVQLAELLAHRGTQTPLTAGLFGGPGSGKSYVLKRLLARVDALAAAARNLTQGPFIGQVASVRISAATLKGEAESGLASGIFEQLTAGTAGPAAAELARDAIHAASDPQAAARDASERVDEARRRLDAERRALDDLDGRRARLVETVLYESAGSRIDSYARANRTRIEPRLRAFGFAGDPIQTYKDLVRDYSERGGVLGRVSTGLRSLWAFEGQTSLIVWAIVLFLIAWGLGLAADTRGTWLPKLRDSAEAMAPVATWMEAHIAWLATLRSGAIVLAVLCLVANVWRAMRFLSPIMRGAGLLHEDCESRRRELDTQVAHQTRRVDMLNGEVDAAGKRLVEAERRARDTAGVPQRGSRDLPFLTAAGSEADRQAEGFVAALSQGLQRQGSGPSRLVVALDDLELVPPQTAAHLVETAQRLLGEPNMALVICADPAQLCTAWGSASTSTTRLERLVQIPVCIDANTDYERLSKFARGLLGPDAQAASAPVDGARSSLDEPLSAAETDLLATLAPVSGGNPRSVKRYVNIYHLARARTGERAALALMLALDLGGTSGELAALASAMDENAPEREIVVHPGEPRLTHALQAVALMQGRNLTVGAAQAAWHIARDYRIPL